MVRIRRAYLIHKKNTHKNWLPIREAYELENLDRLTQSLIKEEELPPVLQCVLSETWSNVLQIPSMDESMRHFIKNMDDKFDRLGRQIESLPPK